MILFQAAHRSYQQKKCEIGKQSQPDFFFSIPYYVVRKKT